MFRKTILALAAVATVGAAALAPTAASAGGWKGHHGHHGHWGHGWGHGGYGFGVSLYNPYIYDSGCYKVKKFVNTPYGPAVKYVTVCG